MTQEHPITPSPELVKIGLTDRHSRCSRTTILMLFSLLPSKPPAGALIRSWRRAVSGCVKLGEDRCEIPVCLRAARRPKPPSLKEQALQAAQRFYANGHEDCNDEEVKDDFDIIRRALESLPESLVRSTNHFLDVRKMVAQ
jgi:hypothetical protein